jgi:hypothetical protein
MGREPLTFDGEPARMPNPLSEAERLAVSYLLDADRARAMSLRSALVDLRSVLARHLVPGGPTADSGRLDYLVRWAEATSPLDHRLVSDSIAASEHTPGARLSNVRSDAIHEARRGDSIEDHQRYEQLVLEELRYKGAILDSALAVLAAIDTSRLQPVYRALERGAQAVWRRRLQLHASDLVRFGRTSWFWRNSSVDLLDDDARCARQLLAIGNPQAAQELARDPAVREIAFATVVSVHPLRLDVESRRIVNGSYAVALMIRGQLCIESSSSTVKIQKGSFKFGQLSVGLLRADDATAAGQALLWEPLIAPQVAIGDEIVVADAGWFGDVFHSGHEIAIKRPKSDVVSAPKADCTPEAYANDPNAHKWCCRPHEDAEAEWSDELAARRERGELNPRTWPPIGDEDEFDTPAVDSPIGSDEIVTTYGRAAGDLTIDDLD